MIDSDARLETPAEPTMSLFGTAGRSAIAHQAAHPGEGRAAGRLWLLCAWATAAVGASEMEAAPAASVYLRPPRQ